MKTKHLIRVAIAAGLAASFAIPGASAQAARGPLVEGTPKGCSFSEPEQTIWVDPSTFETPPDSFVYLWFTDWLDSNTPFSGSVEYILEPTDADYDPDISFRAGGVLYGPIEASDDVYTPNFDDAPAWGPTETPGIFWLRAVEVMGGGLGSGGWSWGDFDEAQDFVSIILDESSYPLTFTVDLGDCALTITYRIANGCKGPYGYLCNYLDRFGQPQAPATKLPDTL